MDWGSMAQAINQAIDGTINLGFGIYDRAQQEKWNNTQFNYQKEIDQRNYDYTVSRDQRDFDYQQALQQQMFEREDTAQQRAVADLEAAGLNKNLAAGQGAGAGAVVSRSNAPGAPSGGFSGAKSTVSTPHVNFDVVEAVRASQRSKAMTEAAREDAEQAKLTTSMMRLDNDMAKMDFLMQIGVPFVLDKDDGIQPDWGNFLRNGKFLGRDFEIEESGVPWIYSERGEKGSGYYAPAYGVPVELMPLYKMFNQAITNSQNAGTLSFNQAELAKQNADLAEKENKWYTESTVFNQFMKAIGTIGGLFGNFARPRLQRRSPWTR